MAEQLNIQDVNNIFQSIISEFKVLFDVRMKPIVDQIQFHSENYKIISSLLKQMPEFKSIVNENEHLKKIEEEYKQLKNTTTGIVLEVKEDNTYSENNISKLYSELNLGSVINITQKNNSQAASEVDDEEEICETEEEASEAEASEAEASEAEASEAEASEAEEAYETDEEEVAASETEAEEEVASEVEEASAAEEEEVASEVEEASAAEEEESIEVEAAGGAAGGAEEEVEAASAAEEEVEEASAAEEEAASAAEASEAEEDKPMRERSADVVECEEEAAACEAEEVEEEFFMIEIEGCGNFYTNDENNGEIYEITENDEVGNKVGDFKNGEVIMI